MLIDYQISQTSIIVRFKVRNNSVATGAGLTGLTNSSAGLVISATADSEQPPTAGSGAGFGVAYTAAGATIDTIATLGTFAAPTSGHCRFKELDSTNHKGAYELQLDNTRYAASGAKSLLVSLSGAANMAECDFLIPLRAVNPYDGQRGGMTALPASGTLATVLDVGQLSSTLKALLLRGYLVSTGTTTPATADTWNVAGLYLGVPYYAGATNNLLAWYSAGDTAWVISDTLGAKTIASASKYWITAAAGTVVGPYTASGSSAPTGVPAMAAHGNSILAAFQPETAPYTGTPPTAASIAALILRTPANLLTTDGSGDVTYNNTAPPTAAQIVTAIFQDLLSSSDFTTNNSIGKFLAALPSAAAIATALWQDLTAGADFTTNGSIGKLLVTNINAALNTLATASGLTSVLNAVNAITSNTARSSPRMPTWFPRPPSGSATYRIYIYLYSLQGILEDADTNTVTVSAQTAAGSGDLNANLSSTTMTRQSTGVYHVDYTCSATDATGEVLIDFSWSINSVAMADAAAVMVEDAEIIATLNAVKAKTDLIATNGGDGPNAVSAQSGITTLLSRLAQAILFTGTGNVKSDVEQINNQSAVASGTVTFPAGTIPTAAQVVTALLTDLLSSSDFNTSGSFGAVFKANLNAAISSLPSASAVATAVWTDLLVSSDFSTGASVGSLIKNNLNAAVGSVPSLAQITAAIFQDLTSSADFTTNGSIGKLLAALPNAAAIATQLWQDLLAGSDFGTTASAGALMRALFALLTGDLSKFTVAALSLAPSGTTNVTVTPITSQIPAGRIVDKDIEFHLACTPPPLIFRPIDYNKNPITMIGPVWWRMYKPGLTPSADVLVDAIEGTLSNSNTQVTFPPTTADTASLGNLRYNYVDEGNDTFLLGTGAIVVKNPGPVSGTV